MKEQPTPETDAFMTRIRGIDGDKHWVPADTAKRLERERDEAQKELSSIHRWIDKNHADGFIDSLTYLQNLERVVDNWYDRIDAIEADARRFVRERDEARGERNNGDIATMTINHYERILRERNEWAEMCGRYEQERDELLQKLDAWKEIAELLHHFVNYPANGVEQAIQRVEVLEAFKHLSNEKTKRR